jgi:hypothetical protein
MDRAVEKPSIPAAIAAGYTAPVRLAFPARAMGRPPIEQRIAVVRGAG